MKDGGEDERKETNIHALILRHFEIIPRPLTRLHELLHFGNISDPRINDVIACQPETIVAPDTGFA